jgi:hypothetical protein
MRAIYPAYLIFLHLMNTVFGEASISFPLLNSEVNSYACLEQYSESNGMSDI